MQAILIDVLMEARVYGARNPDRMLPVKHVLNEAFYQLCLAHEDEHPEENTYKRYIMEVRHEMYTDESTHACIATMWFLLKIQKKLTDRLEAFMKELEDYARKSPCYETFKEHADRLYQNNNLQVYDFSAKPVNPRKLVLDNGSNSWQVVTDGFNKNIIRKIVERYQRTENRKLVLTMIHNEFRLTPPAERDLFNYESGKIVDRWGEIRTIFYDANEKADEQFFSDFMDEITGGSESAESAFNDLISGNPKSKESVKKLVEQMIEPDTRFDNFKIALFNLMAHQGMIQVEQSKKKEDAKENMLAKENEELKAQLQKMQEELDKKRTLFDEYRMYSMVAEPDTQNDSNPLNDATALDKIVETAKRSFDCVFVDNVLTLVYRLLGGIVSPVKDRMIRELEDWSNRLHARDAGINIETLNQYGGNTISDLHAELLNR